MAELSSPLNMATAAVEAALTLDVEMVGAVDGRPLDDVEPIAGVTCAVPFVSGAGVVPVRPDGVPVPFVCETGKIVPVSFV